MFVCDLWPGWERSRSSRTFPLLSIQAKELSVLTGAKVTLTVESTSTRQYVFASSGPRVELALKNFLKSAEYREAIDADERARRDSTERERHQPAGAACETPAEWAAAQLEARAPVPQPLACLGRPNSYRD